MQQDTLVSINNTYMGRFIRFKWTEIVKCGLNLNFDLIYFENRKSDLNSSDIFPIRLLKLNKMVCNKIHLCP